jgi:alkyl sulfatase BDS1-like metallo-beta-lactamase superfamily hydrolase
MGALRDLTDQLWRGDAAEMVNPFTTFLGLEAYADDLAFVSSFANAVALRTAEGLVLIDAGSPMTAPAIQSALRDWTDAPVHTLVYTHGHIDHVMGARLFEAEARPAAMGPMRVVAHRAVAQRFDRYRRSAGYNATINARQFNVPGMGWPTDFREADLSYDTRLDLDVGGVSVTLHHARGETDDHTWLYLPQHRAVCTGDLFIWASPNCGNPQKVQRYPLDQARALLEMAALEPALLLPGHGPPIEGAARVHEALTDTAALLTHLHDATLALMNEGATLDAILDAVRAPAHLLARPYLRPIYDEPEFVVRNVWRLYGGWWDGDAARLKPPRDRALAAEVAALAGGVSTLLGRAQACAAGGDWPLACQLAEWAARAAPDDEAVSNGRAAIYLARAEAETSLMAQSIYRDAARSGPR